MKILSINAGSSSLKFTLIELPEKNIIARGIFEKIGASGSFYTIEFGKEEVEKEIEIVDHSVAVDILMKELVSLNIISSLEDIEGVGHRIVHGGDKYSSSVVLDESTLKDIEGFNDLAPLHNPANIMGARAFMGALPGVINVGVFDTAFHQSMDEEYYRYAVPKEWYDNLSVRKYGFHGTSHKFVSEDICKRLGNNDLKIISAHIGTGASLAAIHKGKVIDTSMGMTPNAGVMMGTRCGDIDTSIVDYVVSKGLTLDEVNTMLNKKSGYLGISGVASDNRDVEKAALAGNKDAILAREMFSRKIASYIAMYNNTLDGADVIIFTAGIGEKSSSVRKMILEKVSSLGIKVSEEGNKAFGEFGMISTDDSKIAVYVVPTDEELMIAMDVLELKNK